MKDSRFILRISSDEKEALKQAAQGHRSLAAFLLSCARLRLKYDAIIYQAQGMERKAEMHNLKFNPNKLRLHEIA